MRRHREIMGRSRPRRGLRQTCLTIRRMIFAGLLTTAGGCATKTETGYEPPQRLGMSDAQRRALYAPALRPKPPPPRAGRPIRPMPTAWAEGPVPGRDFESAAFRRI